jgi:hypothetical protein
MRGIEMHAALVDANASPIACPMCGAAAQVRGGACLGCLLLAGLFEITNADSTDFIAVLAELDVGETG